jgi:hypothetical protein
MERKTTFQCSACERPLSIGEAIEGHCEACAGFGVSGLRDGPSRPARAITISTPSDHGEGRRRFEARFDRWAL